MNPVDALRQLRKVLEPLAESFELDDPERGVVAWIPVVGGTFVHPLTRQPVEKLKVYGAGVDGVKVAEPRFLRSLPIVPIMGLSEPSQLCATVARMLGEVLGELGRIRDAIGAMGIAMDLEHDVLRLRGRLNLQGVDVELTSWQAGRLLVAALGSHKLGMINTAQRTLALTSQAPEDLDELAKLIRGLDEQIRREALAQMEQSLGLFGEDKQSEPRPSAVPDEQPAGPAELPVAQAAPIEPATPTQEPVRLNPTPLVPSSGAAGQPAAPGATGGGFGGWGELIPEDAASSPKEEPVPITVEEPRPEPAQELAPVPASEVKPEAVEQPAPVSGEEGKPEAVEPPAPVPVEEVEPEAVEPPAPVPVEEAEPEPVEQPAPVPGEEPKQEPGEQPSRVPESVASVPASPLVDPVQPPVVEDDSKAEPALEDVVSDYLPDLGSRLAPEPPPQVKSDPMIDGQPQLAEGVAAVEAPVPFEEIAEVVELTEMVGEEEEPPQPLVPLSDAASIAEGLFPAPGGEVAAPPDAPAFEPAPAPAPEAGSVPAPALASPPEAVREEAPGKPQAPDADHSFAPLQIDYLFEATGGDTQISAHAGRLRLRIPFRTVQGEYTFFLEQVGDKHFAGFLVSPSGTRHKVDVDFTAIMDIKEVYDKVILG